MSREDPQMKIRLPADLKDRIETSSKEVGRSMNAEIVARLQETFDAKPLQLIPEKGNWAEQFGLYRLEAQMDAVKTQSALIDMQIRMLDDKLDQLAYQRAGKAQMFAPEKELEAARDLRYQLDNRLGQLREQYQKQKTLADEASRAELRQMNDASDRELQGDLKAIHALEEGLGIPAVKRSVVLKPAPKKPSL
jgi:molybdopterin converting factor small subunit